MKQRSIGYHGSLASSSPWTVLALSAGVMLGSACKKASPEPTPPAPAAVAPTLPAPSPSPAPPAQTAKALEWDDPPQWKKVPPTSAMRKASYEIPAAKGDKAPGELNVFILGGAIEPNIKRWVDEFSGFDPKSLVRHDRTVNDMTQAVVEVPNGTFSGGMGSGKGKEASPNYALLGAIVVTPSGAEYFFKLTGPSATVKAARDPFYKMLDAMRLEGGTPEKPGAAPEKKPDTAPTTPGGHALTAPVVPAGHAPAAPAAKK